MKKSIFIAVLGMGASTVAFGQGQIIFGNYYSSSSPKVNWAATGVPSNLAGLSVGAEVNAELAYYVGTSVSDVPTSLGQMTLLSSSITPFGLAGGDADGSQYAGWFPGSTVTIPGVGAANKTFVSFEVLAFDGSSYASAPYKGASSIFQSPTTGTSSDPLTSFVQGSWQNFSITSVPEPTTLALAGLGGAALLALRRKKA